MCVIVANFNMDAPIWQASVGSVVLPTPVPAKPRNFLSSVEFYTAWYKSTYKPGTYGLTSFSNIRVASTPAKPRYAHAFCAVALSLGFVIVFALTRVCVRGCTVLTFAPRWTTCRCIRPCAIRRPCCGTLRCAVCSALFTDCLTLRRSFSCCVAMRKRGTCDCAKLDALIIHRVTHS